MASGIRGITVKIGGDTTELGKAISKATQQSLALQKELKGVNTLLKYDPKNVTLLKQKQELLTKSISKTETKLKSLNEVLAKADAGEIQLTEAEYRNLQREIASTEQKLQSLKQEQSNFGSVGAQQISAYGQQLQALGTKVEEVGKKFSALSTGAGLVLGGSVKLASDFTDSMAKVNTIADTSSVSLDTLSKDVMSLSNQTGISANEIADATYNAISAGQDTADAVSFVENATSLARAGFTDTASSIDVLTTIMNAYGLEAGEVSNVSDMLIQTQNKGKTTVAELSASMGRVIPTANSMNVGLDQLCAGYSIMTAKGIATAESTTYMNSMLNELGKGGTKVSGILKEKTGKSFQDLMADGNSVGDVLQILQDYADESGQSFNDLWGSAEAGKAGLTLLSGGVDEFNNAVAGMNDSTGATSDALGKLETPSLKAERAINQVKNAGVTLGQSALSALAPLIEKIANSVQSLTEHFNNLSPGVQQFIVVALGIVTAIAPVLIILGKVISSIGTLMTFAPQLVSGFSLIGSAFKTMGAAFLSNPIGLVIVAITALVAGLIYAYNHSEKFRDTVNSAFQAVKETVGAVVDGLVTFFTVTIPNAFNATLTWIKGNWQGLLLFIVNPFAGAFKLLYDNCEGFRKFIDNFMKSVKKIFSTVWNAIKTVIVTVVNAIKTVIVTVFNGIKNTITTVVNGIKTVITTVFNVIKTTITTIWNAIKTVTSTVWNGIKTVILTPINAVKSTVSTVVNGIKSTISSVWNGIKSVTSTVWGGIKNAIINPIQGAKDKVDQIIDGLKKAMNFEWSLPHIKLPHFTVSGGEPPYGIKGRGKAPSIGVDWYKKGMAGMLFNKPTVLSTENGFKGFGEAGAEVVIGEQQLFKTFKQSVESTMNMDAVTAKLESIERRLGNMSIVLDSGALVGGIVDPLDNALSDKYTKVARGW